MRALLTGLLLLTLTQTYAINTPYIAPEQSTPLQSKPLVYGTHQLVVTNNPWASKAAHQILLQGGNAIDAAIAAALVLGLTEPQSSGLGGGGYALTYHEKTKQLRAYDGRETAPASAHARLFLDSQGQPLPFQTARRQATAVGVPSEVALLQRLHQREGKLPWKQLFQPAIELATAGFPMSPRLHHLLDNNKEQLRRIPAVKALYFTAQNHVKPINTRIINRAYAQTLSAVAKNPRSFYTGAIANDLMHTINQAAHQPIMRVTDLSQYQILEAEALCHPYRTWTVCSTPFGSGGVSVLELLALYTHHSSTPWMYRFLEASKLIFADRDRYITDPKYMTIAPEALLDQDYLHTRRQLIHEHAMQTPVAAGKPRTRAQAQAADTHHRRHGTTSLAIVDAAGNGISMTLTIEHEFGSQLFVDGFFLNNELTDFAFNPTNAAGQPVTNQVRPKARPRSAIAPVMVFDKHQQLTLLTGSPGGTVIICYVAKNLIQLLDFNSDPQRSAASGNLCAMNDNPLIEQNSDLIAVIPELSKRGETIQTRELVSGIVTIQRTKQQPGWRGAADPRREGEAIGG